MDDTVLVERRGGVLVLSINRPDRGNALDGTAVARLIEEIGAVSAEPGDVRALVLRSVGKHFCTGADIGGGGGGSARPTVGHMVRSLAAGPHRLVQVLWDCPLPIVVELTGRTSGLGLHVALACDVTVAATDATFAEPFSDRGFNVDSGGSWLLPRFIGLTRAKRLLYSAEVLDAATALDWGLVSEVVPSDDLERRVAEVADHLATRPTFALSTMKGLLHHGLEGSLADALEREAAAIELTIRSDDFKEGMRAFGERRPPDFTGR